MSLPCFVFVLRFFFRQSTERTEAGCFYHNTYDSDPFRLDTSVIGITPSHLRGSLSHPPATTHFSVLMPYNWQVDVTQSTEGCVTAFADANDLPLLVRYDARIKAKGADNVQGICQEVAALEGVSMPKIGSGSGKGSGSRCVFSDCDSPTN